MLEEEFNVDNQRKQSGGVLQMNNFPETTNLLQNKKLETKKETIESVLQSGNLKEIFEKILSSNKGNKLIRSLINCENDENAIKGVILANLPEGYLYNISTNEVVKTEVKKTEDFTGATATDKKGEQTEKKKEQADQKTEQADQKTEQADQKTEQADAAKSKVVSMENLKHNAKLSAEKFFEFANFIKARVEKIRGQLGERHVDLEDKTKEGSETYNKVKNELENKGVIEQIRQISNNDEEFVNIYILSQATLHEVKTNPEYSKKEIGLLETVIKQMNNVCNIPDTNLSSFSQENISETRRDLFNEDIGNDKLRKTRDNNIASHKEIYDEIFPEMGEDDMFIKYGQFLEGNLKNYWDQYKDDYPRFMNKLYDLREQASKGKILSQEEKDFLSLPGTIKGIKEKMDKDTKNMIEELCIISQIKGMYMCMGEGASFDLNKANEIESEDGILTLNGHIDGVDFSIRQNTKKEEPLQTYTKLFKKTNFEDKADKKENFIIGGKDNFIDSNYVLPTQDEIFTTITGIIQSDNTLVNYESQDKYLRDLQANIMGKMEEKYDKTKYIHDYMQDQVKGEKIIDKTISFVENIKGNKMASEVGNSNAKLYDFLNLMNYNIRNSTEVEKNNFLKVMDKINEMAVLAQDNPTDGELDSHKDKFAQYLTGDSLQKTRNVLDGNIVENESTQYVFDLFKNYEASTDERKNEAAGLYMINFDKMLNDLREEESNNSDEKDIRNIEEKIAGM